jgi:hypothetical protein
MTSNVPSDYETHSPEISLDEFNAQFSASPHAVSNADRNRLVKRSKSPTAPIDAPSEQSSRTYEPQPVSKDYAKGPACYTQIQKRDWSGEYRIRTRVETSLLLPPINTGMRTSKTLTDRGARKIVDSCYFMAKCHGGYRTFVTGTFNEAVRQEIANGTTTIQKEVSRTMDGLQKMYQRGWSRPTGERVEKESGDLAYCWVVEIPKNQKGEDNPHVHIMMNWKVPYRLFEDWTKRIEELWGHGHFHLEKIKQPLSAGAYMAKAAGYMTKSAKQEDQGTVKGNRYGISKSARAPEWYTVTEKELGVMGALINEMYELCQKAYEPLYSEKNLLKARLESCPKKNKFVRAQIGKKLEASRKKIAAIPVVTSKYQIIFKCKDALDKFLGWAMGSGWNPHYRPSSLWKSMFDRKLKEKRHRREIARRQWSDKEWGYAKGDYAEYSNIGG